MTYNRLLILLISILPIYLRARRHRMSCADSTIPISAFHTCAEISHSGNIIVALVEVHIVAAPGVDGIHRFGSLH